MKKLLIIFIIFSSIALGLTNVNQITPMGTKGAQNGQFLRDDGTWFNLAEDMEEIKADIEEINANIEEIRVPNFSGLLTWRLSQRLNTVTTSTGAAPGTSVIVLNAGHGAVEGNFLEIFQNFGTELLQHFAQMEIVDVNVNTITVSMPFDAPIFPTATMYVSNADLAVDGSVTPVSFEFEPITGQVFFVTRIMIYMRHDDETDDSQFGSIVGGLANGIYFRRTGTVEQNYDNFRTNGDFRKVAFDLTYSDKAGNPAQAGDWSTSSRLSFGGEDKHGGYVVVNGNDGDGICAIVRDDLTDLTDFNIRIEGHRWIRTNPLNE